MQLGLKNRLRLISLFPIVILFSITSYYVYQSYENYKIAQVLQDKLSVNRQLNSLVNNISRERGMTVMYLGNSSQNTLRSLVKQRALVDQQELSYLSHIKEKSVLHEHSNGMSNCKTCQSIKTISQNLEEIKKMRILVDEQQTNFEDVYKNVYGKVIQSAVAELEKITSNQIDPEINTYAIEYTTLIRANASSADERDFISFAIARASEFEEGELNTWMSLISKADNLSYDTLKNSTLISALDAIYTTEDALELFDDINTERTDVILAADSGEFETSSGIWFAMISEKDNIIFQAEELVLNEMDARAVVVKLDALQLLTVTLTIWAVSILLAILGYLLSNEIAKKYQKPRRGFKACCKRYE